MKAFPTAIETYRQCPRKYAYDRDPGIKRQYRKPTSAMFVGTCVHDALQWFFDPEVTKPGRRTYETLVQLLRDAWGGTRLHGRRRVERREERRAVFGDDRETERAVGEKATHLLFRFVQTQDLRAVPMTAEQFHEVPFGDGRHVLAGKIDRIDRLPDGSLAVIDYKTGKSKPLESLRREDLQLATYSIIVGRKFRVPVSRCAMLYVGEDRDVGWTPEAEWLAAKTGEILALMDRAETDREMAPRPSVLCGWCDYRPLCPEGRAFLDASPDAAAAPPGEEIPF